MWHWVYYHTWLLAATHMHTSNSSIQCSQAVGLCTQAGQWEWAMYTEVQWAHAQSGRVHVPDTHHHNACCIQRGALAKAAMLWRTCSRDFTRVAVYLVMQMDFSRWKVVRCGKLSLHWTLNRWQRPSRWANHAITRQQHIDSKIYRVEIENIIALDRFWSF